MLQSARSIASWRGPTHSRHLPLHRCKITSKGVGRLVRIQPPGSPGLVYVAHCTTPERVVEQFDQLTHYPIGSGFNLIN